MTISAAFNLTGKVALVTGCNRGIGQAMAVALAEAGATIIGVSANLLPQGSAVQKEVEAIGRSFYPYLVDLSDRVALQEFIETIKRDHPIVDILVNNAGIIRRTPAVTHADEDWHAVMQVNLDAPFYLARAFGRDMLSRGSGKIIFTASLLSFQGGINVPGYTAAKSAIAGLTKALSNEWASKGVQVNAIAPGYIETDNTEALRNDVERNQQILHRIPAGRWGTPQDLKGPILFLASAASDYVTGTTLVVDGGWMGR
jgi:2-deoxy-D-gluconate 3-dehydrogenase